MQHCLLGHIARADLEHLAEDFADFLYRKGLYAQAPIRIAQDRAEGRTVMLATAAPRYYIEPLAARLGIEWVVATKVCWQGDLLQSSIEGDNCRGAVKRDMLCAFLEGQGMRRAEVHIRFYSDHFSDRHTFDWADEAIAVNPSRVLLRYAVRKGWQILDWRKGNVWAFSTG